MMGSRHKKKRTDVFSIARKTTATTTATQLYSAAVRNNLTWRIAISAYNPSSFFFIPPLSSLPNEALFSFLKQ